MAAYSMDLRLRVLRDADAGLPSDELAEKYSVSRAWVDRLKQRRRETGEVAPRKQTRWRPADPPRPAHGAGGPDPRAAGSHAGRMTGGPAHAGESPHAVPHDQTARRPV